MHVQRAGAPRLSAMQVSRTLEASLFEDFGRDGLPVLEREREMQGIPKEMTLDEAVEGFKQGAKLLLCEYRHGKAERVRYRDKVTGKAAEFVTVRHTIEVGSDTFLVTERVPDDFDEVGYRPAIAKGARCVLQFDRFEVRNGVGQFVGRLIPIVVKASR